MTKKKDHNRVLNFSEYKKAKKLFVKNGFKVSAIVKEIKKSQSTIYNWMELGKWKQEPQSEGKKKKRKMNDFTDIDIDLAQLPELHKYQVDFLKEVAEHKKLFYLKSRQIGFSYILCLWGFLDLLKTGTNKIYISSTERQVMGLNQKIKSFSRQLFRVELRGTKAIHILLPDGVSTASFHFLSSNSIGGQGEAGDMIFDECSWIDKLKKAYQLLAPTATRGYRILLVSTPSHKGHFAYDLWSGVNKKGEKIEIEFFRKKIDIHEAIQGGMPVDAKEVRSLCFNEDMWNQDYLCQWVDTLQGSFFKRRNLEACFFRKEVLDEAGQKRLVKIPFPPFNPNNLQKDEKLLLGVDPSGEHHTSDQFALCAVWCSEKFFRVIDHFSTSKLSISEQCEKVIQWTKKYHPLEVFIDAGGIGRSHFDKIQDKIKNVTAIQFNHKLKEKMVLYTNDLIEKKLLQFRPDDLEIIESFLSVQIKVSESGLAIFTSAKSFKKDEVSHGDIFWAVALVAYYYFRSFQKSSIMRSFSF